MLLSALDFNLLTPIFMLPYIRMDLPVLEKSYKKFYGRYQDLIEKYHRSVKVMVNDSFPE